MGKATLVNTGVEISWKSLPTVFHAGQGNQLQVRRKNKAWSAGVEQAVWRTDRL